MKKMQPMWPVTRIEVFKTSIEEKTQAVMIADMLHMHYPDADIHFDLDDCDRILRIEGTDFTIQAIELLVRQIGFQCSVLP